MMRHAPDHEDRAEPLNRRSLLGGLSAAILALPACATTAKPDTKPVATIALPVFTAWVDGRLVRYITTDASDPAFARRKGINHAPRLADALPRAGQQPGAASSVLERVYMFEDEAQINVFPSAPLPVGPGNRDTVYSPLWRAVMVRWADGQAKQELRSEEAIMAAEERGWLRTTVTALVVNCPVVASA
jgi:hypothetical protein